MKISFRCPVCGDELRLQDRTYKCRANHCYDLAKQGYVNLLQSQKSSKKRHGDDTLMVKSRQDFLEKGYYNNIREELIKSALDSAGEEVTLLDLGCGECWYTAEVYKSLVSSGADAQVFGIDISKQALIYGSRRCKELRLAVASTSDIPLPGESCDIVMCVFAPYSESEIYRVLKKGGVFIKAFPLENHLMGLKRAIYDKPYQNEVNCTEIDGFYKKSLVRVSDAIKLNSSEDIMNLFRMTPYYYKTGRGDQQKIAGLTSLETETEFGIVTYTKQ